MTSASGGSGLTALSGLNLTVTVVGTNLTTTTGADGRFVLAGVPAGSVQLRFTGSGVDATLPLVDVNVGAIINIIVLVHGSSAELVSAVREHGTKVELEGLIESISSATKRLVVRGRTVQVNDNTEIRHGDRRFTFADLHVGDRVHVKGEAQGDTVLAMSIFLQNPAGPGPAPTPKPPEGQEVEVKGTLSGLGGTCPTLSFMVGGQRVVTNASTKFEHGACGDLRNGDRVEVEGMRQSDGSILAREVERENEGPKPPEPAEVEVEGTIASLGGTCPTLSFVVKGQRVTTNASTKFDKLSCSDVKNGMKVDVEGFKQSDGSILAKKVKRDD